MSRPGPLVWGDGAEQLNKYLKDLREGNCPPPPSATNNYCDTVPFSCSGSPMSRAGPLVWGEGAEQLNKYLKDLREGNWTLPPSPFPLQPTNLVILSLY